MEAIIDEIRKARRALGPGDITQHVPGRAKSVREYFVTVAALAIRQIEVIDAATEDNAKRGRSLPFTETHT